MRHETAWPQPTCFLLLCAICTSIFDRCWVVSSLVCFFMRVPVAWDPVLFLTLYAWFFFCIAGRATLFQETWFPVSAGIGSPGAKRRWELARCLWVSPVTWQSLAICPWGNQGVEHQPCESGLPWLSQMLRGLKRRVTDFREGVWLWGADPPRRLLLAP